MLTEAEKVWKKVLEEIKEKAPPQAFSTWFEPTKGASLKQNTLWVLVPNSFFIDWIEEHYHSLIYDTLTQAYGEPLKIKYHVVERIKERIPPSKLYRIDSSQLQSRYTFDNFVIGDGNKFARAASFAVATVPGKQYNPLFLYGTVGLGKTHLLQAIGNYVKEKLPELKVYYTSCETFMNEMVDAIQNNKIIQFKKKYRFRDVLLIDDIQFLEAKESLQEEIFHTFNSLYDAGKQVVISSDRPPSALATLEERLVSRFQGGLVCDIKPPSFEIRLAILKKKAELSGIQVPDEIINFIAERIKSNIRELEGALIKLFALTSLTDTKLTLESAKELLKDVITKPNEEITINKIQKIVTNYYKISLTALRGKRRQQSIVRPRQVAIYLAREHTPTSLKEIGNMFGNRNHATIIHDYNKVRKLIDNNEDFKEEVNNILKLIKGE
ncbi:chromosomal replication initiator protein DnaA [candidate division WOR-3 bacterium]|nr:chromosomal replication initiator protein DnaA [candidate division WOR-3 bacterium]